MKSLAVAACLLLLGGGYVAECGYAEEPVESKVSKKDSKKKKGKKKKSGKKYTRKEKASAVRKLKAVGITEEQYEEKALDAALKGNVALLENLLKAGVDVNCQAAEGNSLLWCAARDGHADCVKLLLGRPGIEVNTKPHPLWTAVYSATRKFGARMNDCIPLLLAVPGIDLNCREQHGIEDYVPLAAAVVKPELFKLLLDAGADVNAHNGLVLRVYLEEAVDDPAKVEETGKMLFAAPGFDPNVTDENGNTVLHRTCVDLDARSSAQPELTCVLNIPGIDVNKTNAAGDTPLILLLKSSGATDECKKLLMAAPGIDLNKKGGDGKTPLQVVKSGLIDVDADDEKLLRAAGATE